MQKGACPLCVCLQSRLVISLAGTLDDAVMRVVREFLPEGTTADVAVVLGYALERYELPISMYPHLTKVKRRL